jgi:hypothetical protein
VLHWKKLKAYGKPYLLKKGLLEKDVTIRHLFILYCASAGRHGSLSEHGSIQDSIKAGSTCFDISLHTVSAQWGLVYTL